MFNPTCPVYWISYCKVTQMGGARRSPRGDPQTSCPGMADRGRRTPEQWSMGADAEANMIPFSPLLAAEHTSRLELGTNIVVAFCAQSDDCRQRGLLDLIDVLEGRLILVWEPRSGRTSRNDSCPGVIRARRMREFARCAACDLVGLGSDVGPAVSEGGAHTHKVIMTLINTRAAALSCSESLHRRCR